MNRRHALAPLLLLALAATSGCVGIFGPPPVDEAGLAEDAEYEWNTSRAGYIEVHESNYTAVYAVANRTTGNLDPEEGNFTIEVYTRDALGTEQPLQFTALQFRYPNGTTVRYEETAGGDDAKVVRTYPNGTQTPAPGALYVDRTRKRTVIHLPANDTGKLAFTVSKNGKSIATPTFVEGSYEMVLPERARIGIPLLAQVRPQRDDVRITEDGNRRLIWNDLQAPSLNVRYYLARDLLIFAGIVGIMIIVGIVGAAYYLIQIRRTVQKREEVGLDVEVPDDDREGPPPGMR